MAEKSKTDRAELIAILKDAISLKVTAYRSGDVDWVNVELRLDGELVCESEDVLP